MRRIGSFMRLWTSVSAAGSAFEYAQCLARATFQPLKRRNGARIERAREVTKPRADLERTKAIRLPKCRSGVSEAASLHVHASQFVVKEV
jgi:hypothetical protein